MLAWPNLVWAQLPDSIRPGYTHAVVIAADLPRLAHLPAGSVCRFAVVDAQQAAQAQAAARSRWSVWQGGVKAYQAAGWVDESALLGANLIDGMINATTQE